MPRRFSSTEGGAKAEISTARDRTAAAPPERLARADTETAWTRSETASPWRATCPPRSRTSRRPRTTPESACSPSRKIGIQNQILDPEFTHFCSMVRQLLRGGAHGGREQRHVRGAGVPGALVPGADGELPAHGLRRPGAARRDARRRLPGRGACPHGDPRPDPRRGGGQRAHFMREYEEKIALKAKTRAGPDNAAQDRVGPDNATHPKDATHR
ncbi:hypothetical protein ON010_g919 [Phytophthora cinnamomi]|nr:hypothetical protein ON010_g919 [Phytophthora cinnamomi]